MISKWKDLYILKFQEILENQCEWHERTYTDVNILEKCHEISYEYAKNGLLEFSFIFSICNTISHCFIVIGISC